MILFFSDPLLVAPLHSDPSFPWLYILRTTNYEYCGIDRKLIKHNPVAHNVHPNWLAAVYLFHEAQSVSLSGEWESERTTPWLSKETEAATESVHDGGRLLWNGRKENWLLVGHFN